MTKLENQSQGPSHTPAMEQAIPMTSRRIGSWEVLISRRTISSAELARRYDAVSGRWERTARRFQLDVAYQPVRLGSAGFASTAFWARRPQ
jgi:demethylmenaquinone methyltransferase/2-methoxy-6-polyprenyl-1,4-benzoquinol methylase